MVRIFDVNRNYFFVCWNYDTDNTFLKCSLYVHDKNLTTIDHTVKMSVNPYSFTHIEIVQAIHKLYKDFVQVKSDV